MYRGFLPLAAERPAKFVEGVVVAAGKDEHATAAGENRADNRHRFDRLPLAVCIIAVAPGRVTGPRRAITAVATG